jgi:NAD(P)-dependent dehydrogenase (short-subunit alcohol dehydrogenase family)
MEDLRDRVALVTGATGGLGSAVVRRLLAGGARVHGTWRAEQERAAFQRDLGKTAASVTLHRVDLTAPSDVTKLFEGIAVDPGRLDILVCLAGGFAAAPIEATAPSTWDKMLAINATSAFLCCRAATPLLRAAAGRGRIVNVAARPAVEHGAANMSAYAASKAALLTFTYSLAKELTPQRISVNAIVPTTLETPANRQAMSNADTRTWLPLDEVAAVVAFLAGDTAGVVTGSAINLSRG